MTQMVSTLLRAAVARLRAAGVEQAALDARLLIGHALSLTRTQLACQPDRVVDQAEAARVAAVIARREAREPVSRILGRREFWSLDFALVPDTLDPRPDSETVVEAALAMLGSLSAPQPETLDLGTGTGCLLLAILSEVPNARGWGLDISPAAVAAATANAERLGLAARARFLCLDWREGLAGPLGAARFDLIVANPPYIPEGDLADLAPEVTRFDPKAALVGGRDGLDAYRQLAPQVPGLLVAGGGVVFEVGAGQAAAVTMLLARAGLTVLGVRRDLAGVERCVLARWLP